MTKSIRKKNIVFIKHSEPIIIDGTIQSIDKYIQTGNWQRFNYDSMLKGRQLGIDYTELINRSLLFNISSDIFSDSPYST